MVICLCVDGMQIDVQSFEEVPYNIKKAFNLKSGRNILSKEKAFDVLFNISLQCVNVSII